jgi:hypothetical protein
MNTISRLLLACATVTFAANQADAGEFLVTGPGGYRYRNAPPPSHGYVPWRYQHRDWARRDWAPRYYAPQYQNDLGAAIAGALAGAALQLIPRATEALAARLPPPPAAPPLPPNAAPPPVAAVPPPAAPPPAAPPLAELPPGGDPLDAIPDNSANANRITRAEIEAALTDWCASHGDAPLCVKMQAQ